MAGARLITVCAAGVLLEEVTPGQLEVLVCATSERLLPFAVPLLFDNSLYCGGAVARGHSGQLEMRVCAISERLPSYCLPHSTFVNKRLHCSVTLPNWILILSDAIPIPQEPRP